MPVYEQISSLAKCGNVTEILAEGIQHHAAFA